MTVTLLRRLELTTIVGAVPFAIGVNLLHLEARDRARARSKKVGHLGDGAAGTSTPR